jgi:hypothetical protein
MKPQFPMNTRDGRRRPGHSSFSNLGVHYVHHVAVPKQEKMPGSESVTAPFRFVTANVTAKPVVKLLMDNKCDGVTAENPQGGWGPFGGMTKS